MSTNWTPTETEARALIADHATKIAAWAHIPGADTRKVLLDTIDRLKIIAETIPDTE